MAIKIDTAAVASAAAVIDQKNKDIRNAFPEVESRVNGLAGYWEGDASACAQRSFRILRDTYCQPRYDDIDSLVRFLQVQVGQGYENTEKIVSAAAAAFK